MSIGQHEAGQIREIKEVKEENVFEERSGDLEKEGREQVVKSVTESGVAKEGRVVVQRVDALMLVVGTLRDNYVRHMGEAVLLQTSDT